MSTAIPTMTSMLAAPSNYGSAYAQAPTMTSMYATPGASMYMPATTMAAPAAYAAPTTVVETVAAAPTTVVAAPTITQAPSYVAAPQTIAAPVVMAAPQMVETVVAPQAAVGFGVPQPVKLTAGLAEPSKLEAEKAAYGKALEAQLKKQTDAALEEAKIKKAMLEQQAKTALAQFQLQTEEQLKMSCLQVDQECQNTCNGLREAAITQQTALEERIAIGVADYNKKKALEEYSVKSWEVQKQWFEKETAMTQQYQQVMKAGSKAVITAPAPMVAQPGMVIR